MIRPKMRKNKLSKIPHENIIKYVLVLSCLIMNISYSIYESMFIYEIKDFSFTSMIFFFYRIILITNFIINIILFLSLLENEKLHHEIFFKTFQSLILVSLLFFGLNYNIKSMMILFFLNINTFYASSQY